MNPEFWAIIGVGVALAGQNWYLYGRLGDGLSARLDRIETRLASIEAQLQHSCSEVPNSASL